MVFRRLLVIALLALVGAAGVAATTGMANITAPTPAALTTRSATPGNTAGSAVLVAVDGPADPGRTPVAAASTSAAGATADAAGTARRATGSTASCVQQPICAGGALLAGATLLLFVPATGPALPSPAPAARVAAAPTRLRSALLAGKLFRPPRAS